MQAFEVDTWLSNGYLQQFFKCFRTIVPGKVAAFDSNNNTATITVALQDRDASQNLIAGTITLYQVPCLMGGGQQNYASFELSPGDYGLLLVCDRDIDSFKQNQGQSVVASQGVANLKDSIFIAGLFLPPSQGLSLYSSSQISLSSGAASIVISQGQITLTGKVVINNDLTVIGKLNSDGNIVTNNDVIAGGISLQQHVHGNVSNGDGTTGEPQ